MSEQEKREDISTKLRGVVYILGGVGGRRAVGVLPGKSLWATIGDQVAPGEHVTLIDVFEIEMGDEWHRWLGQIDRVKRFFRIRTPIEALLGKLFIQIWEAGLRARNW